MARPAQGAQLEAHWQAIVSLLSHQHLSNSTRAHPIACTAVRLVNSVLLFLQAEAERGLSSADYTSEAARPERSLASQWREVALVRLPCTALQYTLKHRHTRVWTGRRAAHRHSWDPAWATWHSKMRSDWHRCCTRPGWSCPCPCIADLECAIMVALWYLLSMVFSSARVSCDVSLHHPASHLERGPSAWRMPQHLQQMMRSSDTAAMCCATHCCLPAFAAGKPCAGDLRSGCAVYNTSNNGGVLLEDQRSAKALPVNSETHDDIRHLACDCDASRDMCLQCRATSCCWTSWKRARRVLGTAPCHMAWTMARRTI